MFEEGEAVVNAWHTLVNGLADLGNKDDVLGFFFSFPTLGKFLKSTLWAKLSNDHFASQSTSIGGPLKESFPKCAQ